MSTTTALLITAAILIVILVAMVWVVRQYSTSTPKRVPKRRATRAERRDLP